jgi:hypothetical protein
MTVRFLVRCLAGAAFVLSAQVAIAQQGTTLSPSELSAFQANPGQLLTQFPNGGPGLVDQVTELVSADRSTVATIIGLAKNANEDQRKAIAQALAQVAKAAASSDPAFANQIQQAVVSSGLPELAKAYADAAGDTGTASTGGGGGGGGPTALGPPIGGANTGSINTGNTFATTQAFGLTGSTLGGVSFSEISPR